MTKEEIQHLKSILDRYGESIDGMMWNVKVEGNTIMRADGKPFSMPLILHSKIINHTIYTSPVPHELFCDNDLSTDGKQTIVHFSNPQIQ